VEKAYEVHQEVPVEGFTQLSDGDVLVDDPARIEQYRAVALAEGLQKGTPEQVVWAWQWLSDHPDFTDRLEEWFTRRVRELREMGRIN
jgi:hypothetical protein